MLGWHTLKTAMEAAAKTELKSATLKITEKEINGTADTSEGARPVSRTLANVESATLKLLARKFYTLRKPDAIDFCLLRVDWEKGIADVTFCYEKNGNKIAYNERHTF